MTPAVGRWKPVMIENSVVLPAPFGPISAVMRPVSAVNETWSSARRPPKRFDTRSSWSKGSALAVFRRARRPGGSQRPAHVGDQAGDPARGEGHHKHERAAVDPEIEAR